MGGSTVDHEKLAEAQIREMTAADISRHQPLRSGVFARAGSSLPRLQLGRDFVEGSEPHANSGPIQGRCIEDHDQGQRGVIG